MNKIAILPSGEVDQILQKLEAIARRLEENGNSIPEFVDNTKFCEIMGISKRTSQTWRDEGKVKFSQIGHKIFYSREDVLNFLERNKF